ncbi:MAG: OsmC family protein [Bacteroidota bacterium]
MAHQATITWQSNMAFEAAVNGHQIMMDADASSGGGDQGARPKILLLAGLGGCTGMDVISILAKMKIVPLKFWMEISAELTDEHPKVYNQINLVYCFQGDDLPMDKLEKAVSLSKERYCGVSAMLSKTAEMHTEIKILP